MASLSKLPVGSSHISSNSTTKMKLLLTLASTFAIVLADGGYPGSGSSQFSSGGSFNFGDGGYATGAANGAGAGFSSSGQAEGQVYRYVSVHTAPQDPDDQATRTIQVPGGKNKHVNIVFIKSPSNGADQKTEIVLPEQDEQKSLVYVLVQKTDPASNIKITKPQASKPTKPEVYFIRYKNAQQTGQQQGTSGTGGYNSDSSGGAPSTAYGSPSSTFGNPSTAYGAP